MSGSDKLPESQNCIFLCDALIRLNPSLGVADGALQDLHGSPHQDFHATNLIHAQDKVQSDLGSADPKH